MEIANKYILITGASRGIGRAFANICAEDKAHLILVLRQESPELVKELESKGARSVEVILADLRSFEGVQYVIEQVKGRAIDILFNNAGILAGGLVEKQSADDLYRMLQVNLNAVIHLTQGLLPGMIERRRGKIINNSSVSAFMHFPYMAAYSASKAAVAAFTDCLKIELKGTGVTTLLLITPPVKTRMFEEVETLYTKNFQLPNETLSPAKYAEIIREAVLYDLSEVSPSGMTGFGLKVAKYAKPLFDLELNRRFKRS